MGEPILARGEFCPDTRFGDDDEDYYDHNENDDDEDDDIGTRYKRLSFVQTPILRVSLLGVKRNYGWKNY